MHRVFMTIFSIPFHFHLIYSEIESQAINVVHPRNRKLPTQLVATSHDALSVGSKAAIKIVNTTGYQDFTSQGLLESPTENTGSQVRNGASRSETLKQE